MAGRPAVGADMLIVLKTMFWTDTRNVTSLVIYTFLGLALNDAMNPHALLIPYEPGTFTADAFEAWFALVAKKRSMIRPMVFRVCGIHRADYETCGCQQREFLEKYMKTQRRLNPAFVVHIVTEMCNASETPCTAEARAALVQKMLVVAETILIES